MDEVANRAAEIELYADIVKIGIPAITGLLGAFIGVLATLLIEKSRINAAAKRERQEFYRQQIANLINDLSEFSGSLFTYISLLSSRKYNHSEALESKITESGIEMLSKNIHLKKAKVALCILNHSEITELLDAYDEQASIAIDTILHSSKQNAEPAIKILKLSEKKLFKSLHVLLSIKIKIL